MPSLEILLTFVVAATLVSISPGPSNFYIMARSIGDGRHAGYAAATGMAVGSLTYVLASALGIATIFIYSPLAYLALKLAGAAYLLYLAYQYFRSSNQNIASPAGTKLMTSAHIFRQSIVVELSNPKTAIFFLAFLPQFVEPSAGMVAMQLVIFGLVYAVIALINDLLVATLAAQLGAWLSSHPRALVWQARASGCMLLAVASYILYDEWHNTTT